MKNNSYIYTVYDTKNRGKIIAKGTAGECAEIINCDRTVLEKAARENYLAFKRYKVTRKK